MFLFYFLSQLWALLHFIMPTLFDNHEEFNDWFSKDIESHVEKQSGFDEGRSKWVWEVLLWDRMALSFSREAHTCLSYKKTIPNLLSSFIIFSTNCKFIHESRNNSKRNLHCTLYEESSFINVFGIIPGVCMMCVDFKQLQCIGIGYLLLFVLKG